MKNPITHITTALLILASFIQAASDTDVTLVKVKKVTIEENLIVIVVEAAKSSLTLIKEDNDPNYNGQTWLGRPVTSVQVISNEATFTIKQDADFAPGGALAHLWKVCLKNAKDLQEGKEVGRIGFYHPDIVIKNNVITAISGSGFLYAKGQ